MSSNVSRSPAAIGAELPKEYYEGNPRAQGQVARSVGVICERGFCEALGMWATKVKIGLSSQPDEVKSVCERP